MPSPFDAADEVIRTPQERSGEDRNSRTGRPDSNDCNSGEQARRAWAHTFGDGPLTLRSTDAFPFESQKRLGKGEVSLVQKKVGSSVIACKRVIPRSMKEQSWIEKQLRNEVDVLQRLLHQRHKHIVEVGGAYAHQQNMITNSGCSHAGNILRPRRFPGQRRPSHRTQSAELTGSVEGGASTDESTAKYTHFQPRIKRQCQPMTLPDENHCEEPHNQCPLPSTQQIHASSNLIVR